MPDESGLCCGVTVPLLSCAVGWNRCRWLRRGGTIIKPACIFSTVRVNPSLCVSAFLLISLMLLLLCVTHFIWVPFWEQVVCYDVWIRKHRKQIHLEWGLIMCKRFFLKVVQHILNITLISIGIILQLFPMTKTGYINSEGVSVKTELALHSFFFFHSYYYHCFVLFSPLFLVHFFSVWSVLSSSWDHSPRCDWPCLAVLWEKDIETLRSLRNNWPSTGATGQAPQGGAHQGVRLKVTFTPNTVV